MLLTIYPVYGYLGRIRMTRNGRDARHGVGWRDSRTYGHQEPIRYIIGIIFVGMFYVCNLLEEIYATYL